MEADVVVVGAGNAALCAALSAQEAGAKVVVLEWAPKAAAGGNTAFTGGGMRVPYRGLEDLLQLMPDLPQADIDGSDFGSYTENNFYDDLARVTDYRCDPEMAEMLVTRSFETLRWMNGKGVQFIPSYGRQAFKIGGKQKFWGGSPPEVSGGGRGLIEFLTKAATSRGVEVLYGTRARSLESEDGVLTGVRVRQGGQEHVIGARSVVLGSGGFEANAEWRARYLGVGWDLAKVRGTRYNVGDGIKMALDYGALPYGNWSGCHAVGWELNAPDFGDLDIGHGFNKHHYHLGIMVNANGERFVDEGADIRNFTYAKYGRRIIEQPSHFAWQIFDAKVSDLLQRDYYRIKQVTRVTAETLPELVAKLDGVHAGQALRTIDDFNASIGADLPEFNPTLKDGRHTEGLPLPKSNWANRLDTPPYEAFAVTCGVTFTFGGLRITTDAQVVDLEGAAIDGLFACGELVGGIFYNNYPGGSGLTWGSVTGRIAGRTAAQYSSKHAGV